MIFCIPVMRSTAPLHDGIAFFSGHDIWPTGKYPTFIGDSVLPKDDKVWSVRFHTGGWVADLLVMMRRPSCTLMNHYVFLVSDHPRSAFLHIIISYLRAYR